MQLTHESGRVEKTVEGPKGRTRRLLLEHASILLGQGQIASVAEVAQHAGVSRATAYRYFPTRGKMISAVVDFSLGPVRQAASSIADGRERIEELFRQTFPRLREYEPQLRAALQVSLSDMALERAGKLDRGTLSPRPSHRHPQPRGDAAQAAPAQAWLRPAGPGPVGGLRHRGLCRPARHLGRPGQGNPGHRPLDRRRPRRGGAARCRPPAETGPARRRGKKNGAASNGSFRR